MPGIYQVCCCLIINETKPEQRKSVDNGHNIDYDIITVVNKALQELWNNYRARFAYAADIEYETIICKLRDLLK